MSPAESTVSIFIWLLFNNGMNQPLNESCNVFSVLAATEHTVTMDIVTTKLFQIHYIQAATLNIQLYGEQLALIIRKY